ncbi:hypothetical protein BU23DRAFT_472833 [Bimuria novae-zelandiae CBS 107.79]|uniref:HD domain-containing protein n=1 Tax=Bimuria novae-zelandiae CBS 107.79 TaxID=1447943 RepID=A0A6A5V6Y0_9PLEO|nr:hypothetical protein BU23DRAFT_472833 [Bimuria novae-zelandiae CBS 107.79]
MVAISFFTRVIAGIPVPNTPLINSSIALARAALPDEGYNHVMRSWLNGQAIINKLPEVNRSRIDQEAFSVAAILHDLGWSNQSEYISTDKRFEIDGAFAAQNFIQKHGGPAWTPQRLQLVWDAIALHTTSSIARYKEAEVAITSGGVLTELFGPATSKNFFGDLITVDEAQWARIVEEFPNRGLKGYFNDVMAHLCLTKPDTTWDNFVSDYGEVLVEGFNRTGHRTVDLSQVLLPQ